MKLSLTLFSFLFWALLLAPSAPVGSAVSSAIDLDGVADWTPYEGAQPELVYGATSGTVTGPAELRHAYLVAPHILALTIDEFGIIRNAPVPYEPQPGDEVRNYGGGVIRRVWEDSGLEAHASDEDRSRGTTGHFIFVHRDGEPLGHLVGKDQDLLWPVEALPGEKWDWTRSQDVDRYGLVIGASEPILPEAVIRKTRPHGKRNYGPSYSSRLAYQHTLLLVFGEALPVGDEITLVFPALGLAQKETRIQLDDTKLRTEAIQVSQAGYHPDQPVKRAYLSTWMGNGGAVDYGSFDSFEVVREGGGVSVYTGRPERIAVPHEPDFITPEDGAVSLKQAYVYALDFPNVSEEGTYRVRVPGLGVSFPFPVSRKVWDNTARLQMLGYYHQRSGMELGPPASDWKRPRNFHPEDRPIFDVDRSVYFDKERYSPADWRAGNPFTRLQTAFDFSTNVEEAWGGWADAADYDRRVPHLRAVQAMLFLHELNPGFFEGWNLSLPAQEAGNAIPDILDEALWCAELWRRTQLESGEVIEGVESIRHPKRGEASFRDSLSTGIKAGTPRVAYKWAGTAARMSSALEPYDPALAAAYLESALTALAWADAHREHEWYVDFQPDPIAQMEAGFFLYRATGESRFYDRFVDGWKREVRPEQIPQNLFEPYVILAYALMDGDPFNPELHQTARRGILGLADSLLEGTQGNAAWLIRKRDGRPNFAIVEQAGSEFFMGAHRLTGDPRYLEGLLQVSHFTMGANPLNLCYTTGMGQRFIEPFYLDYEYEALPIPAGIPAYGPIRPDRPLPANPSWGWYEGRRESYRSLLQPSDILRWPLLEAYFRYTGYPAMNEYTVQQGMREQLTRWGYLAQHFAE